MLGSTLVLVGYATDVSLTRQEATRVTANATAGSHAMYDRSGPDIPADSLTRIVQRYCVICHNDVALTGNLSLQDFDVAAAPRMAETAEKMIVKLRAGMMPPPGMPRPTGDTLLALVESLESRIDEAAAANPNPGSRTFQRLNRAE